MLALIAFGGNALLRPEDRGTLEEQLLRAENTAKMLIPLIKKGYRLVVVHGNGPQVGNLMEQMEAAASRIPPLPLDVCDAMTEGSMGYMLEQALHNVFTSNSMRLSVATMLTLVRVDEEDPAFQHPTKPVGPFYTRYRAEQLMQQHQWKMVEDAGRGWRKVVPSPRPKEILNMVTIQRCIQFLDVLITGGGGGIPVVQKGSKKWVGVEAVIDKDYTASLLAQALEVDLFIILTGVPQVYKDFGTPREKPLEKLTTSEAAFLLEQGQFPKGSMGPKIQAAIEFTQKTKKPVLITDSSTLEEALEGKNGTYIVA